MARYNVVDRQEAGTLGFKTDGEYNQYALISMVGDKVDGVVCWGYKRENLQAIADKRNEDLSKIKERMEWGPSRGDRPPRVDPTANL